MLDKNKPIYLSIKEIIENMIITEILKEDEQIPSTTVLSSEYNVNHLTILKSMSMLVEEQIIYKKRGLGMFVSSNAKGIILKKRLHLFKDTFMLPLMKEASNLGLTKKQLIEMIEDEVKL